MNHDPKTGEILPPESVGALAHAPPDVLSVLEQRDQLMTRVLDFAIKATHSEQWVDLQGKPFPTAAAAEVMARRCGVSITGTRPTKRESTDDQGRFFIYEYVGLFQLANSPYDFIEAMGNCSSRDQFLGTETGAGRKLSEIVEGDIMKAAYSDMVRNGVTRLLGVRNLSWARLESLGITRAGMAKVEFKEGAKGGGASAYAGKKFKFGQAKGKAFDDPSVDLENVEWYLGAKKEKLEDPKRAKYRKEDEEGIAMLEKILEARKNPPKKTPPTEPAKSNICWDAVVAMAKNKGMTDKDQVLKLVADATQGKKWNELTESDVALVKEALEKKK